MRRAEVVIGAGFGDEGKGLVTDFLAAPYGTDGLVIRFNGGAQAGHTVTTPTGQRHVFHHVGSGALAGAATYLSRYFVCNPLLLEKELPLLFRLGCQPKIYADPDCLVTTPYDMMINQIVEAARGAGRHGSCGQGFGETIARNSHAEFTLTLQDLADEDGLLRKLQYIRQVWTPRRLAELGIDQVPDVWWQRLSDDGILDFYLKAVALFLNHVALADLKTTAQNRPIVFEGAQGLMLDQDKGWFPHVTRSNTGLKNAAQLAAVIGITDLRAHYLTRAYATRHGAGPLAHETVGKPYQDIVDATNQPNDYQGTLRFGWLDLDLLGRFITDDLTAHRHGLTVSHDIAVTCLDQVGSHVTYVHNAVLHQAEPEEFIQQLQQVTAGTMALVSHGPTRATLSRCNVGAAAYCEA
jgi:adenylosuccinate synthase